MTSIHEARSGARVNLVIGFDADDTLWHNEPIYRDGRFAGLTTSGGLGGWRRPCGPGCPAR